VNKTTLGAWSCIHRYRGNVKVHKTLIILMTKMVVIARKSSRVVTLSYISGRPPRNRAGAAKRIRMRRVELIAHFLYLPHQSIQRLTSNLTGYLLRLQRQPSYLTIVRSFRATNPDWTRLSKLASRTDTDACSSFRLYLRTE